MRAWNTYINAIFFSFSFGSAIVAISHNLYNSHYRYSDSWCLWWHWSFHSCLAVSLSAITHGTHKSVSMWTETNTTTSFLGLKEESVCTNNRTINSQWISISSLSRSREQRHNRKEEEDGAITQQNRHRVRLHHDHRCFGLLTNDVLNF